MFYTEVQGFSSKIKGMPPTSVIQGSKMSSILYSLFTLDTVKYQKIMTNKKLYKLITGKNLKKST